jgi:predicted protein tyrosine phosphatase
MTTPYNPSIATKPVPAAAVVEARQTCRELMSLLIEENAGIKTHDIALVDMNIQHKRRLTLRLEQMLVELKQSGSIWKADVAARQQATFLAEEIAQFQELARSNAMMLKAAHQMRADLIIAIRDTVDAAQPKAQLYGSNGTMSASNTPNRLVAKDI